MAKGSKMKLPKAGRHGESHVHLHRPKMSVIGKSAYGGGAPAGPPMAFPTSPGGDPGAPPAFGPAGDPGAQGGLGGGAPVGPPGMGAGGGPAGL